MKSRILLACLFVIGLSGYAQEVTLKTKTIIVTNNGGDYNGKSPLIFVNGKSFTDTEMKALNPDSILSINILKDATAILKYGEAGKNGVILIATKGHTNIADVLVIDENLEVAKWPLYFVNGVKLSKTELMAIKPEDIESISVLKDAKSIATYGTEAQNGVVLIITKKEISFSTMSVQLTKAEEQVMQALWKIGSGSVQEVLEVMDIPKPARTTVSTVLTILENKGFASHTTNGRANKYKPLILKEDYSKGQLFDLLKNYFDNSFSSMTSFFAKESNFTVKELDNMIESTRKELQKEQEK